MHINITTHKNYKSPEVQQIKGSQIQPVLSIAARRRTHGCQFMHYQYACLFQLFTLTVITHP